MLVFRAAQCLGFAIVMCSISPLMMNNSSLLTIVYDVLYQGYRSARRPYAIEKILFSGGNENPKRPWDFLVFTFKKVWMTFLKQALRSCLKSPIQGLFSSKTESRRFSFSQRINELESLILVGHIPIPNQKLLFRQILRVPVGVFLPTV